MFRDHPEYLEFEQSADDSIVKNVEEIFMRELELVGFHRVLNGETPWFFLRATIQPSSLRGNSVSGVIEFGPMANFNRDLALSLIEEPLPPGGAGMLVPIEAEIQSRGHRVSSTTELERLARVEAVLLWKRLTPTLFALCDWRTQLVDDGLTVEVLYERLVDRIVRIRSDRQQRTHGGNR